MLDNVIIAIAFILTAIAAAYTYPITTATYWQEKKMALEVKFHEILKVWVIADNDLRELLVHPDGHVLQFDSKEAAEKVAAMEVA